MAIYSLDGEHPVGISQQDVFVAPGAHLIGRVRLGAGVGVWFGAVLRGDNEWIEIGADTNIQDNAVLHSDPGAPLSIGAGCTIGHGAIVHGCTIGDNCLVGMGATILNGARIGRDSIVGANALVTENKSFPDGWLIMGAPAKPVRELDEAAIEALRESARRYRANAQRFAAGLRRIDGEQP
ncbi:gamma carbonic anhydrase family protein [Aureimonas endophytica]|uniref:Gamma carbonic anhydrase family protein n=1 Tax=Aureimonas endophytica TaxID=2027858 RepID=A0A916ZFW4_9HYPH|nr:gamma carbonic anhydrase family protein [Aureimonas endophytica]GGD93121.1 gamma carbonic anhydrase family protein [Aureimonas endophytica]